MEPQTASPDAAAEPERIKKSSGWASSEYPRMHPGWRGFRDVRPESCQEMQHRWEAQWQEFLETVASPSGVWGNPESTEAAPWDDAKAFLASFEQVAKACRWPRGEWAARLQPALSGEAKQAFGHLEASDREDYGKVKAAILRGDALQTEVQRQQFRQFRYEEVNEPRRIHSHLQELCCRWLRPERRSKEQILELLILEQFLASLPLDLQGWIRAGGPDTCSQAVALMEDFLMSQQETEREKWQEPLPQMTKNSPEAEKTSTGILQKQVQKEAKQKRSRDNSSLDGGNQISRDPCTLLPPSDEPEIAEADLTEVSEHFREADVTHHVVETTPATPTGQQTMFWHVMQEEGGDVESLEGLLVPKPEFAPRPEEADEEMFIPFPIATERLLGQDSGDEKRRWRTRETAREEKAGAPTGLSPWLLPATTTAAEAQEQRCDGKRRRLKMEASRERKMGTLGELPQWNLPATAALHEQRCEKSSSIKEEETQPEEAVRALTEMNPWNPPLMAALHKQTCESDQELERRRPEEASSRFSEALTVAMGENSTMKDSRPKPFFVSRYGRKCNYRLGFATKHLAENPSGGPVSGDNIQGKASLVPPPRIPPGKKTHMGSECGKSFLPRPKPARRPNVHTRERPYACLECGKSFLSRRTLVVHQIIHTGEKPFGCPECGICFNQRTNLLRHQRIHTGEKVHACPKCGKTFYRRDKLVLHQRVHAGENPHEYLQGRQSFTAKEKLLSHQRTPLGY